MLHLLATLFANMTFDVRDIGFCPPTSRAIEGGAIVDGIAACIVVVAFDGLLVGLFSFSDRTIESVAIRDLVTASVLVEARDVPKFLPPTTRTAELIAERNLFATRVVVLPLDGLVRWEHLPTITFANVALAIHDRVAT